MYEIVIGGWANTRSAIREIGKEPQELVEVATPDIVSSNKMHGFWIRWNDNAIAVGREDEDVPFMFHEDPNIFPINYVGISTGFGSTGTWLLKSK